MHESKIRRMWWPSKKFREGMQQGAGFFVALLALGLTTALLAQTYRTFASGDLISASYINENFSYLKSRVESPLPYVESASSGSWFNTSGTWTDATNLSVTVTTDGSPIWLGLIADGTNQALLNAYDNSADEGRGAIRILRDGVEIAHTLVATRTAGINYNYVHLPPGAVWHIDNPGPGTYTYKIQGRAEGVNGVNRVGISNSKLVAARFNEL